MLGNFFESFAPRLLLIFHTPFKKQCVRYPSGSAHVAAGLSESADPEGQGCEACGSMGKIVLFLVSFSSFYGGGGGGLMVVPRLPEIGSECKREHGFQVWGRSGAFGGLLGLPGNLLGCFLVSRGVPWGGFCLSGEPSGPLLGNFIVFSPRLLPIL